MPLPAGRFVLDATDARPRVFAACDLGFAPVKSLVEHALASEAATSIDVLWLSTRPDGRYLENQCRAWADSLDAFRYAGLSGDDPWLDAGRLVEAWHGRAEAAASDVFIAGPEAFVEAARVAFAAAGVPPGCLHAEAL